MEAEILAGLVQRGVPLHIARGMVANMIAESGLRTDINEIAPLVPGSRGGYGLNQWTGPRRVAFERFAADRGVDPSDLNAQLDFTLYELQGPEAKAWNALRGARDEVEAARIYSEAFLRPGIPHMDRRLAEAQRLAGVEPSNALSGGSTYQTAQEATQRPVLRLQSLALDPAAFMRPTNSLRGA